MVVVVVVVRARAYVCVCVCVCVCLCVCVHACGGVGGSLNALELRARVPKPGRRWAAPATVPFMLPNAAVKWANPCACAVLMGFLAASKSGAALLAMYSQSWTSAALT